jgi:hypothetical protein
MLYPGTEEDERRKARAFAAQWLAEPLQGFHQAGHRLPYESLLQITVSAGERLIDLHARWQGGLAMGDLFKALYALAKDAPEFASWENSIRIYETVAKRARIRRSRSVLREVIRRFRSVAHLWGAWSIRDGKFGTCPELGYDGWVDFQFFLAETEILRDFGQVWQPDRARGAPPLGPDVWRVHQGWDLPVRQPGWPNTGMIPDIALPDDLTGRLRRPGRPREAL